MLHHPAARYSAPVIAILSAASVFANIEDKTASQNFNGAGPATFSFTSDGDAIRVNCETSSIPHEKATLFVALRGHDQIGSAILPFGPNAEGSTVFLPFNSDVLLAARPGQDRACLMREWRDWKWSDARSCDARVKSDSHGISVAIPKSIMTDKKKVACAIYLKDMSANNGWGKLVACNDPAVAPGENDKYIGNYFELDISTTPPKVTTRSRLGSDKRVRIYQLLVRAFGNTNETRKSNGTIIENGVGKFTDINDAALTSLRDCGFTHIWLTGVPQQATGTDYSDIGQPADDPDLLKGVAGSPYAIKDYFDVCPDYADKPSERLEEFKQLLERIHHLGLKAIIDLVPNHVARSYNSDIKPEFNFGAHDDTDLFFSPKNNFFYLTPDTNGPPLHLPSYTNGGSVSPTCKALAAVSDGRDRDEAKGQRPPLQLCDGLFDNETRFGRVTGNNKITWQPGLDDWYETVKLNYGYDFREDSRAAREYPNAETPDRSIPDTWEKVDHIIEYWQAMGVDGFRCDMAHMIPPEFWSWELTRARDRDPAVFFMAEAYNNDPAKVGSMDPIIRKLDGGRPNVMISLLNAGFSAVYDDPTYRALKKIYEGGGLANDIDTDRPDDFIFQNSLRYAENHDEVRLAAKSQWGGLGMKVGLPVSAILYGLSRGPVMTYNGQEVGEPAEGVEGFGGDDARTSIFDYWSMPELVKWVNQHQYDGGKLSPEQKELRASYAALLHAVDQPAFRDGIFVPLNPVNRDNPAYGRLAGESTSGHWLYSFARMDPASHNAVVVVTNLNPKQSLHDIKIRLPDSMRGIKPSAPQEKGAYPLKDLLENKDSSPAGQFKNDAIEIAELAPLKAVYLGITASQ
jgi:glycosidase